MKQQQPAKTIKRRYVTIGDASELLGVSIDTVRRWEKAGKLESKRLDGKNRYFALDTLEEFNHDKPLTTSEAAKKLGISPSSVRRLASRGQLEVERSKSGQRLFSKQSIEQFAAIDNVRGVTLHIFTIKVCD